MIKFIYASDIHGDCHDPKGVAALFKFTKLFDPTLRIIGGDLFEFTSLREGASPHERTVPIDDDFKFGCSFIKKWKPNVFLLGNHDTRLWRVSEKEKGDSFRVSRANDFIEILMGICKGLNCKVFDYEKNTGVFRKGNLHFIHGFCAGINALKSTVSKMGVSLVCGHCHHPESLFLPGYNKPIQGHMAGCLRSLNPDYAYNSLETLRWAHGFVYGFISDDGDFLVNHMTPLGDEWVMPKKFLVC